MSWVGFSIVHGQEGQSNGTAQAGTKNKGLNFSLCPRKRGAAAMEASHSSVTQGCRGVCLRPGLNHGHTKPWGKGEINRVCPNWHKAAVSVLITQRDEAGAQMVDLALFRVQLCPALPRNDPGPVQQ